MPSINVRNGTNPFVGVSLHTIAVCHLTFILTVTPLLRAGSLLLGMTVHSRLPALSTNVNTSSD
ncbi:Lipoprotein [Pseudomonas sp. IT-232MI5]